MRRIFLVARHEFIKYVTRRGFIIGVFLTPVWIALAATVPQWIEKSTPPRSFTVVDHAGGYTQSVVAAVQKHAAQDALSQFSDYARDHVDMAALRSGAPQWAEVFAARDDDAQAIVDFRRLGGSDAAIKTLSRFAKPAAPPPAIQPPRFDYVPAPPALTRVTNDAFAPRAAGALSGPLALDAIVVIPPGFGMTDNALAAFWTAGAPKPDLKRFVEDALTQALRARVLHKVAPGVSLNVLNVSAKLNSFDPTGRGASHALSFQDMAQRYAPSVLAFLLVLTIFMNAASLMSAVIEEKSNRIVEVLLSCVSPREFMTGKLLGAAGAAFLTLGIWLGVAVIGVSYFIPGGAALVGMVAWSLVSGPMLPMLIVCFICGLLIYASIFLAIGSMANSVQDAQALLGPTMIIVMAPLLIMPALIRDPNGIVASVLTWVPVYTPFFMMFRLPWHPATWEVIGGLVLMVTTAGLLVFQTGRIFANNVLTSERPPKISVFLRNLVGRKAAAARGK